MPITLIRQVADYCWSNKFIEIFRNWFRDHAEAFIGAPEICGGEHNLEYYNLFQQYLKVYEDTLTTYLNSLDVPIEEFYQEVREFQGSEEDAYLKLFIDCLLASADYESFYKVMVREGKKLGIKATAVPDAKADSKESSGRDSKTTSPVRAAAKAEGKDSDFEAEVKRSVDEDYPSSK